MDRFNPKVSIVIPVYNGANFLRAAIDSALAQTYGNIEVIVVNDGSNDQGATDRIARSYGDSIRYFTKDNGGVATALNLAIRVMSGEYFSWLSHDDLYFPEKIESQLAFLRSLGRDAVLYSDYAFIDADSRPVRTMKVPPFSPSQFPLMLISRSQLVNGCTLLIPKAFFAKSGLFAEELHTTQDYDLWLRMSASFDFIHMPEVLIKSRIHPGQGVKARRILLLQECEELYSQHLERIFREWEMYRSEEPLELFSLHAAIKMERFGLVFPTRICRAVVRRTWLGALVKFNPAYYYLFTYYLLFRLKKMAMRLPVRLGLIKKSEISREVEKIEHPS